MGLLSPLFLIASVALAIPVLLHFLHRHHAPRLAFPALRYLRRAEEKNAFRIRLRQLLLLALRIAAVLLLVTAGAQPYLAGRGTSHEPTSVDIVLDNSASTGVSEGDARFYDHLSALAIASAQGAGAADRVWVLRAGEPWDPAIAGGGSDARQRILDTEVVTTRADLTEQIARARELVRTARDFAAEVHLLSDFQRSALRGDLAQSGEGVRILAYLHPDPAPANRAVTDVSVASGLAPRSMEPSHVAVTITSPGASAVDSVTVRVTISGQVRAAQFAPANGAVVLPFPPLPTGIVDGYAEIDADGLRADDRRFFIVAVRPPPRVATAGAVGQFLDEALRVLQDAGQVVISSPGTADVVFGTGESVPAAARGVSVVVVPPDDPTLLPALNRSLEAAGIPWRYALANRPGGGRISATAIPEDLRGLDVLRYYRLESAAPAAGEALLARLVTGEPWLVEGVLDRGQYLLLASPLAADAVALPLSARMVPVIDWMANRWAARRREPSAIETGATIPWQNGAATLISPTGTRTALGGSQPSRAAPDAGIYQVRQGDSLRASVAANLPPAEADLRRVTRDELADWLGNDGTIVTDTAEWRRAIYSPRRRFELWRAFVALSALLVVAELWVAAAGRKLSLPGTGQTARSSSS